MTWRAKPSSLLNLGPSSTVTTYRHPSAHMPYRHLCWNIMAKIYCARTQRARTYSDGTVAKLPTTGPEHTMLPWRWHRARRREFQRTRNGPAVVVRRMTRAATRDVTTQNAYFLRISVNNLLPVYRAGTISHLLGGHNKRGAAHYCYADVRSCDARQRDALRAGCVDAS